MKEQEMIHETALKTFIDFIDGVANSKLIKGFIPNKNSKSFKSIASASSNLILEFPNIVEKSISIENATKATKAIERKCVSMLQILFSAISITNAEDAISYVRQFHTNLKVEKNMDVDKFMDVMKGMVKEGTITVNDPELYEAVMEDMENLNYYLPDSISRSEALYNYKIIKNPMSYTESVILESRPYDPDNPDEFSMDPDEMNALDSPNGYSYAMNGHSRATYDALRAYDRMNQDERHFAYTARQNREKDAYSRARDAQRDALEKEKLDLQRDKNDFEKRKFEYQKNKDINDSEYKMSRDDQRDAMDAERLRMERDRADRDAADLRMNMIKNSLLDSDVKKANELMPTMLMINFVSKGEEGRPVYSQAVIGVKAKMYPVASDDILNRLTIKHKDKNHLLNFIKATTREISFLKDFLFCIDRAKLDALSQSKRGSSSKLWKVLERRSLKSRIKRRIGANNDAAAITFLHVSQESVEYLKKTQGIDVEDPKVIRPIMEAYNLMGFAILDESNEVFKLIMDSGDDIYEELSFTALDRDDKNSDYKKFINIMTKMR